MTDKRLITEQIVRLQNELAKMQNLLEGEPDETLCPDHPFDCLAITQVLVFPFNEGTLATTKAMATVVLNDQFMVRGLRVMDGVNGLFVSYPLDPFSKEGDCRSVCNPITRQLREHIETCVLEKYQAVTA